MSNLIDLEPGIYSNGMADLKLVHQLKRNDIPGFTIMPGMWLAIQQDILFGTQQLIVTKCQLEELGYRKQEEA